MRKDVKLGFAIGGLLLAVVMVFALVHSSRNNTPPTETAIGDRSSDRSSDRATDRTSARSAASTGSPVKLEAPKADATKDVVKTEDVKPESSKPADATVADAAKPADDAKPDDQRIDIWASTPGTQVAAEPARTNTPMMAAVNNAAGGGVSPAPSSRVHGVGIGTTSTPEIELPKATVAAIVQGAPAVETARDDAVRGDVDDANKAAASAASPLLRPALAAGGKPASKHTIKNGDTFSTVAAAYYGHSRYYKLIAAANPGINSANLKIGTVITLPALDARPVVAPEPRSVDTRTEYRVQSGDNLHRICMRLYGSPRNMDELYALNKAAIGSDPGKLKLGMVLKLPAVPTVASSR